MKKLKTLVLALPLLFASLCWGQSFNDTLVVLGPGNCAGGASANGVAPTGVAGIGTGLTVVGTANTPVFQVASSAAATDNISCELAGTTRSTTGKGLNSMAGFALFYGIVTTTSTSESAPACVSLSMPVPATGETASVAAGTAIAVTSIPVVGSANLTAVTTGQFFTTYLAFTTPPPLPTSGLVYTKVICSFAFGQSAAAAMQVNTPGGIIFTTNTIAWMRQHGHGESLDAMLRYGIRYKEAEQIYAHYFPRKSRVAA